MLQLSIWYPTLGTQSKRESIATQVLRGLGPLYRLLVEDQAQGAPGHLGSQRDLRQLGMVISGVRHGSVLAELCYLPII